MEQNVDFSEFSPISKADWITKATKDLKGKAFTELFWQLEEGIQLAPFYHPEDVKNALLPLKSDYSNNDWSIGEMFELNSQNVVEINQQALTALTGGVNVLFFNLREPLTKGQVEQLFKEIKTEFIETYIQVKENWNELNTLSYFTEQIKGGKGGIFTNQLDWMTLMTEGMVGDFKVHQISTQESNFSLQLADLVYQGNAYLKSLSSMNLSQKSAYRRVQFLIDLSTSVFPEIAKIRALRILWSNILEGYDLKNYCHIAGRTTATNAPENPYSNMVHGGVQSMIGVLGGIDLLFNLPADQNEGTDFTRRIARNSQHILQLESFMHRVVDPIAGSYYVEELTEQLARKAWDKFLELEYGQDY